MYAIFVHSFSCGPNIKHRISNIRYRISSLVLLVWMLKGPNIK